MDPIIDLDVLANDAAQVVVRGVVSGAAVALRDRLARLFTRGADEQGERSPEMRRLDETGMQIEGASGEEREAVIQQFAASWRRRLMVFLEDHPDAVEELRRIVAEFAPDDGGSSTRTGSMSATGGDNAVVILSGRDTRFDGGLQR